jgi:hypothetical protein
LPDLPEWRGIAARRTETPVLELATDFPQGSAVKSSRPEHAALAQL